MWPKARKSGPICSPKMPILCAFGETRGPKLIFRALDKTCQQADIYWDGPSVPFRACFLDEKAIFDSRDTASKSSLVI